MIGELDQRPRGRSGKLRRWFLSFVVASLATATAAVVLPGVPTIAAGDCSLPGVDDKCEAWAETHRATRPYGMDISDDGKVIAVAGKSDVVAYDQSGEVLWNHPFTRPGDIDANGALGVAVSPDGRRVFATGQYGWFPTAISRTIAYDALTGARLWTAESSGAAAGDAGGVALDVSGDGTRLYALGQSCNKGVPGDCQNDVYAIAAFSADTGERQWLAHYDRFAGSGSQSPFTLRVSPDGSSVYVVGSSATVALEAGTGQQRWAVDEDTGDVFERGGAIVSIDVAPDGSRVYVAGYVCDPPDEVSCPFASIAYDAVTGTRLWLARRAGNGFSPASPYHRALVASPDGARVYVTGELGTGEGAWTVAYDAVTGQELWADTRIGREGLFVAVSPDSATAYVATGAFDTVAYDATTGAKKWTARYEQDNSAPHGGLAASADGTRVYVAGTVGVGMGYVTVAYDTGSGQPTGGPWTTTGALGSPRSEHTATALASGGVLVTGGCTAPEDPSVACQSHTASTEIYRPSGTWVPGPPMSGPRAQHAGTRLGDATILVSGGCLVPTDEVRCAGSPSAELYDPDLPAFAAVAPMGQGRLLHTATLPPSGKVLIVGGKGPTFTALASSELYDPGTRTFSATTGPPSTARHSHTATLLDGGRVLIAGGADTAGNPYSSAEIYDPVAGTFTPTAGPMAQPRYAHTATLMASGRVLVAGGTVDGTGLPTSSAEVYDPGTGIFSRTGSLLRPRTTHAGAPLPGGKVLVAGGLGPTTRPRGSSEVYDPTTGTWTLTGFMRQARSGSPAAPGGHTLTGLSSGKVLVVGGTPSTTTELYAPMPAAGSRVADFDGDGDSDISVFRAGSGSWFPQGGTDEYWGTEGDIAVPGDYDGVAGSEVAVFRPSTGTWFVKGGATTAWGTEGDLPVPGDYDGDAKADIAVFRPGTGVWYIHPSGGGPDTSMAWGTAGDIAVPGDYDANGTTDIAVFRPSTGAWYVKDGLTTNWGTNGDIPVPGDYDGDGDTDIAVFRPSTGSWFVLGGATLAWGTDGDIPVPGDFDGNSSADIAVFRPSTGTWFVNGGATTNWGTAGDQPLPLPASIRQTLAP